MRVRAEAIADEIDQSLRMLGSPERAVKEKAYLKSELQFFGSSVPAIQRVVRETVARFPDLHHDEVVALVSALWAVPVHERRMAAVKVLEHFVELLGPEDMELLESLLRDAGTWAYVDGLAASVAGPLFERCPQAGVVLDRWAADADFWLRRSALLALLAGLRRGEGDFTRFARYAEPMLTEREFFIRKAIGWVLRETGKKSPQLVYEWLRPRVASASGVTVREAVKYLPAAQREELLAARGRQSG